MSGARNTAARDEGSAADWGLQTHIGACHAALSRFIDRRDQLSVTGQWVLTMALSNLELLVDALERAELRDEFVRPSERLDEDAVTALLALRIAGRISDDPTVNVIAAMVDEALAGEVAAGRVPA